MLEVRDICKQYRTGSLVQHALDHVSLRLRDSEFVAILGPSGSGKTTLLNLIGGLDRYDSGDLCINGVSTKRYKDRDWDAYRNHMVGFVFQSYNLIPHQTILSNVELALTISGVSKAERRQRARQALEAVGLGEQVHKKPNQLSGGQMQRVAIARALVNNPEIVLADEPTGALDSETSVQVMELLKEVAKDRLVVMVTHNPELARRYATRIVTLKDGKIREDSDPVPETAPAAPARRKWGKASMSFLTALSLSFQNLWTKKARTILTSFAGSIGIIGIALILAISNGVNAYIASLEEETLSEYPLQIQSTTMDFASMMADAVRGAGPASGDVTITDTLSNLFSKVEPNDLKSLKAYLDSGESGIAPYARAVEYDYDVEPQIYRLDGDTVRQVNPNRAFSALGIGSDSDSIMSSMMSMDVFHPMPENTSLFLDQYDVKAGRWPQAYNECVVVLSQNGSLSDYMLYTLGLRDSVELDDMIEEFLANEKVETPADFGAYSYDDFLGITFRLVGAADTYTYDSTYGVWTDQSENAAYMRSLVENGEALTVVGVVQPSADTTAAMLNTGIAYPASLTQHAMAAAAESPIVLEQLENPDRNVLTGKAFGDDTGENAFSLDSLFTIDEDALKQAFSFDESALQAGLPEGLDLQLDPGALSLSGGIDLSSVTFDMPELSGLDLSGLLGQADFSVSPDALAALFQNLLNGYGAYAAAHPEADYSKLPEAVLSYFQSDAFRQCLKSGVEEILQQNVDVTVSCGKLQALVQEILSGFPAFAQQNGMTAPEEIGSYLASYLQTPAVQQQFSQGAQEILDVGGSTFSVTAEQLQALSDRIAAGYTAYAAENRLPDPAKFCATFSAYLQSPEAQQQLSAGMGGLFDAGALRTQISNALQSYLQQAMTSYTGAMAQAVEQQVSSAMEQIMGQIESQITAAMAQSMGSFSENFEQAFSIDPEALAGAVRMNKSEEELTELLRSMMSGEEASFEKNLQSFGYAEADAPTQISIYPYDFSSKEEILNLLDDYNSRMEAGGEPDKVIHYTDMIGTMVSSVTKIVDTIGYVLVAFVAISLIVSSIMIGVITYISVLERRKEIGILRAIGASKHNISQVFNAETFLIGLCAGVLGIVLTLILLIPGNALIHSIAGTTAINGSLPVGAALVLIAISVCLTLLGGLIPAKKAAKSDPVAALRSE